MKYNGGPPNGVASCFWMLTVSGQDILIKSSYLNPTSEFFFHSISQNESDEETKIGISIQEAIYCQIYTVPTNNSGVQHWLKFDIILDQYNNNSKSVNLISNKKQSKIIKHTISVSNIYTENI